MRSRFFGQLPFLVLGLLGIAVARGQVVTSTWSTATSGPWSTAGNFWASTVPNSLSLNDATISATGANYTVTASGSASLSVRKLDVTSANAQVVFDFTSLSFSLSLGNATSNLSAGAVEFRTSNGLFGNGTANTTLAVASGAQLAFTTNSGTRNLSSLTLNNSGTFLASSGIVAVGSSAINNLSGGLVHANGAEINFQNGATLANSGTLRATGANGILRFGGTYTTANLGTVDLVSGGRAILQGTVNNLSSTLNAPTGGSYELTGGTINSGAIASGALKFTSSAGTLNGAALTGDLDLNGNNLRVDFTGGASFSGPNAVLGSNAGIYWKQGGSLTGKALTFGSNAYLYVSGANNALTLSAGTTGTGDITFYTDGSAGTSVTNAGTLAHTNGNGYIYGPTATNSGTITATNGTLQVGSTTGGYNTSNSGTITADGTNSSTHSTIYLDGNVTNTGTVLAQNYGQIYFRGSNTTGHLGTVQVGTNGHVYLNGTLDNSSATLTTPSGGPYELYGGTIQNGTVNASALTFTNGAGTLSGVALNGDLAVPANTRVDFTNATAFSGPNATFGNNSGVYWKQVGALTGKALTFGSGAYLYVSGANNTLTLGSGTTGTGEIGIYTDGSAGTAITNSGTLTHTSAGSGYIYGPTVTNAGSITASAGSLQIGSTSAGYNTSNTGTITADGTTSSNYGTIYLDGIVTNTGTLLAQNYGRYFLRGTNTTGHLGTVQIGANGHVYLNGLLDNSSATLTAPTGGAYELYGGTIQNGTVNANALTFTNGAGTLSGVALNGDLTVPANTRVDFSNATAFSGPNGTFGANAGVYWKQAGTLTGKNLTFASNSYIYVNGVNNTLTLASGTTATGEVALYTDGSTGTAITNAGTINHTSTGTGYFYAASATNSGTLTVNAGPFQFGSTSAGYNTSNSGNLTVDGTTSSAHGTVYLDGNVTNTGAILTQNFGQIYQRGTNTTAHLGNVTVGTNGHFYFNGTLDNTAATLSAPTGGGVYELYGGAIQNGTINSNALTFTNGAGTLSNVAWSGNLSVPASARVDFTNGTTFSGATATLGSNAGIYWKQTGTLSGKALTLGSNSYLYVSGVNSTLTLASGTTATGELAMYTDGSTGTAITNAGTLTHTSTGTGYIYGLSLTNSGTISANAGPLQLGSTSNGYNTTNSGTITADGTNSSTHSTIYLDGNFTNTGTLAAQNYGEFYQRGANTTAHLGTVQIGANSHFYLNGTIDNTAATFSAPGSGVYELYGGTIQNGTVNAGALTFTNAAGTLDGVAFNGNLTLPGSTRVDLANATTISGANLTLGGSSGIYWKQAGTLTGKTLSLGAGAYIYVNGTNNTLRLSSTTTATGSVEIYTDGSNGTAIANAGTITHNSGSGFMYGRSLTNSGTLTASAGTFQFGTTSSGYAATNSGTLVADGAGTNFYVQGFTSTGTMRAQNSGSLILQGTNTTASLGALQVASGGHIYLNGTLDNTAASLAAPSGGPAELFGGTIQNGTIAAAALSFTANGGLLDNVSLLDPLVTLPANSSVTFTNGTTFATGATLGSNALIYWNQSGTLSGKALTFGSNGRIYLNAANASLTLGATTTATGSLNIYSDTFNNGTTIANQAALTHSSGTGTLYAKTFTNTGTITATGGTLNVGTSTTGYSFANNAGGTLAINGAGAAIQLFTPAATQILNNGTISVVNGTLYTFGGLTNSSGTITGTGTINGGLTMAGGVLAPGNNGIGTLNFSGGTLTVTGASTYNVELGGSSADKVVFNSPSSMINIGSGLLTLSLTLTAPPVNLTTYNLISTNTSSIAGSFAGLPNSGNTLVATFNSTPYTFTVNYGSQLVSIQAVPEPSTYALLGVGLAAMAALRRRKR